MPKIIFIAYDPIEHAIFGKAACTPERLERLMLESPQEELPGKASAGELLIIEIELDTEGELA